MRLLNTTSYELKEFLGDRVPDYVIISHRWGDDETTYKDFRKGRNRASVGFEKVMDFCHFARSRVREWVWIDTVCIDKRSSAEVSESIEKRMDEAWEIVGSKAHFAKEICAITGIPEPILTGDEASSQKCVAQKMSWMAGRQTTRPEDMAYALLGLCDVNMPLLYGEGGKAAFRRLQLQIIADSDDETIFAWQAMYGRALYNPNANRQTMLAQAPDAFSHAGDVLKIPASNEYYSHRPHYAMTNRGLLYQGRAKKLWKDRHGHDTPGHYMIHLNCFGPTCDRWPILVCKPLPEQMSYIRVQTQWAPQDLEAEYPEEDREDVELSHVYIV
ncbi:hypothetical protein LTR10_002427 [Elasticomyces elasticus]|nr:hypothetical protein LTR10_002427 [Elasticomyces elasticus]